MFRYFKNDILLRAKHTGAWMIVQGTTVTGRVLDATDFHNFSCSCYNFNPPYLQKKCNSCMQTFLVCWGTSCSNGGLVIARHNEKHYEIIHINIQALPPHCVRNEPLINLDERSRSEEEVNHIGSNPEVWGDVSIRGLW